MFSNHMFNTSYFVLLCSMSLNATERTEGGELLKEDRLIKVTSSQVHRYKPFTEVPVSDEVYAHNAYYVDSHKEITVEIKGKANDGEVLNGSLLTISALGYSTSGDEKRVNKNSLIIRSFMDNSDTITMILEVPKNTEKLLLEFNTLGIENEAIYSLKDTSKIAYHFN